MAIITKIEVQKRNKERVNIYLDGEYAFAISAELVYKEGLSPKMEIDTAKLKEVAEKENYLKCKDSAIRIIERSCKSEKEVREKLKLKGYDDGPIESSIEFLKQYNFINDDAYANAFIKDRLTSKGRQKIKYDLIKKGIPKDVIEAKISDIDSEEEKEVALKLASKKLAVIKKSESDNYKISGKLYRFLISKGYGYDIVKDVVKKVMSLDDFE